MWKVRSFGQGSIALTINQLPSESLPLPVLALSVKADNATVSAGSTAGFAVTVNNTGPSPSTAAAATLSEPLPDLGGGNLWSIDTHSANTNSGDFMVVGAAGSQMLELKAGTVLQSNQPQAVDVTGVTTRSSNPSATLTTMATLASPDVTVNNLTASATITVTSTLTPQTITFGPLADQSYGVAPITLSAMASSGLTVGFAVVSGPATVLGTTLTITGAGVVNVEASQPGNGTYAAATPVNQSFTVHPASLTLTAVFNSKVYDGTTAAADLPWVTSGTLASGDTVAYVESLRHQKRGHRQDADGASGSVNDGNGGNNYTCHVRHKYDRPITPRPITVTAATNTKTYDGTTSASNTPTITAGTLATGDTAAFTETYDNKNVGTRQDADGVWFGERWQRRQ